MAILIINKTNDTEPDTKNMEEKKEYIPGFNIKDSVLKKYVEIPGVTEVTIPNGITKIESFCFADCVSLTSIIIPDSVTSIGIFAFKYCMSLKSIDIPKGVTTLSWGIFMGCSSLQSVCFPETLTVIGKLCFRGLQLFKINSHTRGCNGD